MRTKQCLILGAGGHAKVVLDAYRLANPDAGVEVRDDDAARSGVPILATPVMAPITSAADLHRVCHVAIGDNSDRRRLGEAVVDAGGTLLTIVHPAARVSPHASLGDGVFIAAHAVVAPDATVGRGAIVNHGAVVDHDCVVGAWSHIAPTAALGGGVHIADNCLIGSGAIVLPGVSVGKGSVIGSGAVVTRNVGPDTTVVGVPARELKDARGRALLSQRTGAAGAVGRKATRSTIRLVYAGNRTIGVRALQMLRDAGIDPIAFIIPEGPDASHTAEIKATLPAIPVIEGSAFRDAAALAQLEALKPDYILSVHFPYLFPARMLGIPKIGTLNLHPSLLPYNAGWHTPSWSILDRTPMGATLHWVDEGIDSGDIALQREVPVYPDDTADKLYQRVLRAELEMFAEAIPLLKEGRLPRKPQKKGGTAHRKADLASVQPIDLNETARIGETLDLLRALTTNKPTEAAYYIVDGRRYRVRIDISED